MLPNILCAPRASACVARTSILLMCDPAALAELLDVSVDQIDPEYRRPPSITDESDLIRRLSIACERGDSEIVKLALLAGAAVNGVNTRGLTPLLMACSHGHAVTVRVLLESNADANLCASDGTARAPLHAAAKRGDDEIAKLLLEAKANIQSRARHRRALPPEPAIWLTPLHVAALSGRSSVVGLLLCEPGCDTCAASELGTPLHCAVAATDLASAKLLISHSETALNALGSIPPRMFAGGKQVVRRGPPLLCALLGGAKASRDGFDGDGSTRCSSGREVPNSGSDGAENASRGTAAPASSAPPLLPPMQQAILSLLIEAKALLDVPCTAFSLPSSSTAATDVASSDRKLIAGSSGKDGSGGGGGSSYSLLEACHRAGASAAAAVLTTAMNARAEAAMRALMLEKAESEDAAKNLKTSKKAQRKQRGRSKAAAPPSGPPAEATTSGSSTLIAAPDAVTSSRATWSPALSPGDDSLDVTVTAMPKTLHATLTSRAINADGASVTAMAGSPREALAERARRRAIDRRPTPSALIRAGAELATAPLLRDQPLPLVPDSDAAEDLQEPGGVHSELDWPVTVQTCP